MSKMFSEPTSNRLNEVTKLKRSSGTIPTEIVLNMKCYLCIRHSPCWSVLDFWKLENWKIWVRRTGFLACKNQFWTVGSVCQPYLKRQDYDRKSTSMQTMSRRDRPTLNVTKAWLGQKDLCLSCHIDEYVECRFMAKNQYT